MLHDKIYYIDSEMYPTASKLATMFSLICYPNDSLLSYGDDTHPNFVSEGDTCI